MGVHNKLYKKILLACCALFLIIGAIFFIKFIFLRQAQLKAVSIFEKAIVRNPKDIYPAFREEGSSYIPMFTQEPAENSKDSSAWFNKGRTKLICHKGDYKKAVRYFKKAVDLKPNDYYYWTNLGAAYGGLEENKKALDCFDKAINLDNIDSAAWYDKGIVLGKQGKPLEALACFNNALQHFDKEIFLETEREPSLWLAKGTALIELRQYEEGITALNLACKLSVKNKLEWGICQYQKNLAYAYAKQGIALTKKGNMGKAIIAFQDSLRLATELQENHSINSPLIYELQVLLKKLQGEN